VAVELAVAICKKIDVRLYSFSLRLVCVCCGGGGCEGGLYSGWRGGVAAVIDNRLTIRWELTSGSKLFVR